MKLPFVLLERDEAIHALRFNVSGLQRKLISTKVYLANVERGREKDKRQMESDRLYINSVKAEGQLVVSLAQQHRNIPRELRDAAEALRRALEGRTE